MTRHPHPLATGLPNWPLVILCAPAVIGGLLWLAGNWIAHLIEAGDCALDVWGDDA